MFWIVLFALILIVGALKLGAAIVMVNVLAIALTVSIGLAVVLAGVAIWLARSRRR